MQLLFKITAANFQNIVRYPHIEIKAETMTFLSGESGSGKSTLLKLLNGVYSLTRGKIFYNGVELEEYEPIALRQQVMLVAQTVYLFDNSIYENFCSYYEYRQLAVPNKEDIKEYLQLCQLNFSLETNCQTLSGGERQRVYLAIFLSFKPAVLLLDEPTSALDDFTAQELLGNIKKYAKNNKTNVIVISHNKKLIDLFADDTIYLSGKEKL